MKLLPVKQTGQSFTLVYLPDGHEEPRIEVFDLSHDVTTTDSDKVRSLVHEVSLRFPDVPPPGPLQFDPKATYRDKDGLPLDAKTVQDAFDLLAVALDETSPTTPEAVILSLGDDVNAKPVPTPPDPEPEPVTRSFFDMLLGRNATG